MIRTALVLVLSLSGVLALISNSTGYSVRLVGGPSPCHGQLQVQRMGQNWTEVSPQYVTLRFGHRVCVDIDCGSVLNVKENTGPYREAVPLHPDACDNTSLIHCFDSDTRRSEASLQLSCSDSVRMVSERSLCSGTLQIQNQSLNQSWTPVCEGALDLLGAEVLCRELGCGAALLQGPLSPLGQMFHCDGHEPTLRDCNWTQTGINQEACSGPALHLTCSEPLKLVGGASRCEGTVEAELRGEWRRVLSYETWDLECATAVCRDLDCGSALYAEMRQHLSNSDVWAVRSHCVKKSSAVRECVIDGPSGRYEYGLHVLCSDSVRLVGGRSLCSGFLQIQDQSWTPVCEGALDRQGAEVLCRELGCGAPLLQGALSPLGQAFHCEGHEPALRYCNRTQTRTDPGICSGPALHLTCSEPLRLVGGASRCEGTVEAELRGEWRRLMLPWGHCDLECATAVCRDLDCGSAVSTEKQPLNYSAVWAIRSECVKKSSAVRECVLGFYAHSDGLQVVCSELLNFPEMSVSEGLWAPRAEGGLWARVQEGDWVPRGEAKVWVMMGEDFQIKCSVEPQYPGGYFQLISPSLNLTLPAVNHSAHFLFTDVSPAHKGNYTCVYQLQVFNHNFTSNSTLYIYPGDSDIQLLLRALILLLLQFLNLIPYFYYRRQVTRGRQSSHRARYRAVPEEGTDAVIPGVAAADEDV